MLDGFDYLMPNVNQMSPVDLVLLRRMIDQYGADVVKAQIDRVRSETDDTQRNPVYVKPGGRR